MMMMIEPGPPGYLYHGKQERGCALQRSWYLVVYYYLFVGIELFVVVFFSFLFKVVATKECPPDQSPGECPSDLRAQPPTST